LYEDTSDTMIAWAVALFGGKPEEKPEQYGKFPNHLRREC